MQRQPLALVRLVRRLTLTAGLAIVLAAPAQAQLARDMIDLSQVRVYNSPADVASWPITHAITALHMRPSFTPKPGLTFESNALNVWPDYWPPGWDGPLQYTVWAVVRINGVWYTSGFIQMWRGRGNTGGPILTDFAPNWAYDSRWGPMAGHQPVPGEQMGFFLTAGNARGVGTVTSVRERTNVVLVSLPAGDLGDFAFNTSYTRTVLAGDFNNDAMVDLVSQGFDGKVSLSMNNGTSYQQVVSPYNGVVSAWKIVGIADINGDGRKDLFWQGPTGSIAVWLNNGGSNPPTAITLYAGASDWRLAAVADLDRNGTPDLIWQSPAGQLVAWMMSGTTVLAGVDLWRANSDWRVIGAGDFNNDNNADLVWQGPTGSIVVWFMSGSTMTSAAFVFSGSSNWLAVSVGDVNGDNKPDIIWRGPTGQMAVWQMNGMTIAANKYLNELTAGWQLSSTP